MIILDCPGKCSRGVIEILEILYLPGLSACNLLQLVEILKILVISLYTNWVFSTKEEGASTFKTKDNSSEFFVVGVVVILSREEAFGVESH